MASNSSHRLLACLSLAILVLLSQGFVNFEEPPISYSSTRTVNHVTRLQARLDAGETNLRLDDKHGALPDLLRELDISAASQALVFAKSSRQRPLIDPGKPRALYFNDEVYVGQVNGGFLEVVAADPMLGMAFYSLDTNENPQPKLVRETDRCLTCHAQIRTRNVPGLRLDSLFVDADGQPIISGGVRPMSHKTPFDQRWGGWYVQGSHGEMWHRGNQTFSKGKKPQASRNESAQNLLDLGSHFDVTAYLAPTSDLVALMVLVHQAEGHNVMTAASFAARKALHDLGIEDLQSNLTAAQRIFVGSKIDRETQALVDYFLFVDEAALHGPIAGPSSFASEFERRGPFDSRGRSLREFELESRMFKYPLSYLIYSDSFVAMPLVLKQTFFERLGNVLSSQDTDPGFSHLSAEDRRAISEIVVETYEDESLANGNALL